MFHFLDGMIVEWGVYLFSRVRLAVGVGAGLRSPADCAEFSINGASAPGWHCQQPAHATAATNHHLRISPAGRWFGLNQMFCEV